MLRVRPLPAFQDNYIWVIQSISRAQVRPENQSGNEPKKLVPKKVVIVDPGDAQVVIDYLSAKSLTLKAILITHHHPDHTGGLLALKKKYAVPVYGPKQESIAGVDITLTENDTFQIPDTDLKFSVLDLPGHTLGHIAYFGHDALFCGDTLFSAGCGRMFEGTPALFSQSLEKIAQLPASTAIYCTHEYTLSNLRFAQRVEPSNLDAQQYQNYALQQRKMTKPTLPTSLALELKINPFLRCHLPLVQQRIAELCSIEATKTQNDSVQTFAYMRQLKDNFS